MAPAWCAAADGGWRSLQGASVEYLSRKSEIWGPARRGHYCHFALSLAATQENPYRDSPHKGTKRGGMTARPSSTLGPAVVQGFDSLSGCYILNVKTRADTTRVRLRGGAAADGGGPSSAQTVGVTTAPTAGYGRAGYAAGYGHAGHAASMVAHQRRQAFLVQHPLNIPAESLTIPKSVAVDHAQSQTASAGELVAKSAESRRDSGGLCAMFSQCDAWLAHLPVKVSYEQPRFSAKSGSSSFRRVVSKPIGLDRVAPAMVESVLLSVGGVIDEAVLLLSSQVSQSGDITFIRPYSRKFIIRVEWEFLLKEHCHYRRCPRRTREPPHGSAAEQQRTVRTVRTNRTWSI
jgi:hypothetical protein